MQKIKSYEQRLLSLISSNRFFKAIIGLLVLESAWIALSSVYPMAFDENFHFGIIRLYASHISPFWSSQPSNANVFGAVNRDPSYLYQYLMSFAYRFLTLFTKDQNIIVIVFRFIDIALFSWGVWLYRKLLLKTGASKAIVNSALLIFVLIPVTPLLAAQINYDDLLLPVTALALIMTINYSDKLKKKDIDLTSLSWLICLLLLGSLVKYAFLPISLACTLYLLFRIKQNFGLKTKLIKAISKSWKKLTTASRALIVVAVIISAVLFAQRYVINLVDYHTPVPQCSAVLSVNDCKAYGPWSRNYNLEQGKASAHHTFSNTIVFIPDWFYGMWLRLFFAVAGPGNDYQTRGPLVIPALSAIVFIVAGAIASIVGFKRLAKSYDLTNIAFLNLAGLLYVIALFLDDLQAYLQTGQAVAVNGRYLLPVMLPFIVLLMMGTSSLLRSHLRLKVISLSLAAVCLLWGGGGLTYILRSNDSWYWHSQPVYDGNHAIQHILGPITPGYKSPIEFL